MHSQTERGLRQYLGRALREGCTPAEVLDALLMAFPMLGLAKIVWAVDIILAMDLPEFQPGALGAPGEWHDVMATKGFKVGDTQRVECDGRGLFVHRAEKEWRVYDSRCPHQTTDIPHLALEGCTLTCPKHEWAVRRAQRRLHQEGQQPAQALAQQGRQGPPAGALVDHAPDFRS